MMSSRIGKVMVLAVALCLAAAPAAADLTTKFDFAGVSVGYSNGILSIVENATTTLDARIIDTSFPATPADVTKILDPSLFDLYLTATIVNPAGMNNIAFCRCHVEGHGHSEHTCGAFDSGRCVQRILPGRPGWRHVL